MKLSENIATIFAIEQDGTAVTVQTILDRVSVKSFGILLVIFSIPSAMPVPAPGYSIPGGIALVLLGMQLFMKRNYPWLPKRVLTKEVHVGRKPKLIKTMVFFLRIMEFFIRPRLNFVFTNPLCFRILAAIVLLCGLSMIIPVPLTNTAPAFGVFLIGMGMLEEDGLLSSAGVLAGLAGLALSVTVLGALIYFGSEGIIMVEEFIKGLFR